MARGPVNRHRGLQPGELTRRYHRRHDEPVPEDQFVDDDRFEQFDDYWDPWEEASAVDFQLNQIWEGVMDAAFIRVRAVDAILGEFPAGAELDAPVIEADALVEALQRHLALATGRETREVALAAIRNTMPREQVRAVARRDPVFLRWLDDHRGPGTMLMMLAPFWRQPLVSWSAPASDDSDAVTRSLLDHLFARYPIPAPLYRPWSGWAMPSLKWASWLVLVGAGASLKRAGALFGWRVSTRLVAHLFDAPAELEPIEAVMWAEIAQRGGTRVEFDRLRRDAAYVFDPTSTDARALVFEDERADQPDDSYRTFWLATVDWLVRHRDAVHDYNCEPILAWAMHRYIEDAARNTPAHLRFSWSGRTPASALEPAVAYVRTLANRNYLGWGAETASWRSLGYDWTVEDPDHTWEVRELTHGYELGDESNAMQHCVASYVHRCVQGGSAIFSVRCDGERAFTVELAPRTRQVVQARGPRNRPCTADELAVIARWLAVAARR